MRALGKEAIAMKESINQCQTREFLLDVDTDCARRRKSLQFTNQCRKIIERSFDLTVGLENHTAKKLTEWCEIKSGNAKIAGPRA